MNTIINGFWRRPMCGRGARPWPVADQWRVARVGSRARQGRGPDLDGIRRNSNNSNKTTTNNNSNNNHTNNSNVNDTDNNNNKENAAPPEAEPLSLPLAGLEEVYCIL